MRRLLVERDLLHRENEALRKTLNDLTSEVQDLRKRFQAAWQQIPDRLHHAPGDSRKLGLSVTRIEAC